MRPNFLLVGVVLCAAGAGCTSPYNEPGCGTLYDDAARNLTQIPVRALDDVHLKKRLRQIAARAWDDYSRAHAGQGFSPDFADGFRAGYADFLYSGGPGLPPAVPPFPYQLRRYESPEGHLAIEQWYAGFSLGSEVARDSGLRENVVIPLSQPPINAVERHSAGPVAPLPPVADPPAPAEELPPPRPADPPQ
jgi:hypothetical protein